jgi:DNA-binding protein HU-beta
MNKAELADAVAKSNGLTKSQAKDAVESVLDEITKALKREDDVRLIGFGTFSNQKKPARTARNPQTGKPIKVKARKAAKFKPGAALNEAIQRKR